MMNDQLFAYFSFFNDCLHFIGSMTTDSMCASAMKACQEMKARLKVVEDTMDNPSWLELIQECYTRQVDLSVRHQ